jgi:hypothetical protein
VKSTLNRDSMCLSKKKNTVLKLGIVEDSIKL